MESKYWIFIEILICFIVSFFLVYIYSRRGTNPLAIITAGVTWGLNFILIVFIPYDIYYAYSDNINEENSKTIKNILYVGYNIIYWALFICSWIFIPLMQEYEDSGAFTIKNKIIASIKSNLIYYSVLGIISIIFLVSAFFIFSDFKSFILELMNFSYFIGLLLFYFLFGYSIINLPIKAFYKTRYEEQVKYLEWRAIDLKHDLEKIKKELIDDGYLLQNTLRQFEIDKRYEKSKVSEDDDEKKENNIQRTFTFSSNELKDYSDIMQERYNYLYDNSNVFDIELRRNTLDNDKEPLQTVKELVKLNRKINKNEWDDLRIQIKIRSHYKQWATLLTFLIEEKDNYNIKTGNIEVTNPTNSEEGLIPNKEEDDDLELYKKEEDDEKFFRLKNFSKYDFIYYQKLRRPLLYIYLGLLAFCGGFTIISQIGVIPPSDFSIYGAILRIIIDQNFGILGLHFFIMIPIIFLFLMSIYTFFKLNISGYFYMYKDRQTDSVSLMFFSTNLCRISFSICLDVILNIDSRFDLDKITQIERLIGVEPQFKDRENKKRPIFYKLYDFTPLILVLYILILFFKIPQKIAKKCCKKQIFSTDTEDSMENIKEGHDYYMEINKNNKGELMKKLELILPGDKYNQ